jgi:hypothetical protein
MMSILALVVLTVKTHQLLLSTVEQELISLNMELHP